MFVRGRNESAIGGRRPRLAAFARELSCQSRRDVELAAFDACVSTRLSIDGFDSSTLHALGGKPHYCAQIIRKVALHSGNGDNGLICQLPSFGVGIGIGLTHRELERAA